MSQSHEILTLYLINDGSTDGGEEIVRAIDDQRIVHVDLAENQGAAHARNVGLSRAHTSLIAFMDSDDIWLPRKLQIQIQSLRRWQQQGISVSVVGCGWTYLGSDTTSTVFSVGPFSRLDVLSNRVPGMGTPKLLIDRSLAVSNARFDETFPSLEEGDYVMSCLANGTNIMVVPDVLLEVRRGLKDHMGSSRLTALGWEAYLDKYSDEMADYPALVAWYSFRAARDHLKSRDIVRALDRIPLALSREPVRRTLHLVLGVIGGRGGLAVAQKVLNATRPPKLEGGEG